MNETDRPQPSRRGPGPLRRRLRHLPSGLLGSGAVLVVAAVTGAVLRGATGAVAASAGVVLVAASFTLSGLAVAWADSVNPRLVMTVGLTTYVVKFALLAAALAAIAGTGWAGTGPMAAGVVAAALGWAVAQAWWTWHARILYVEVD